MYIDFVTAVSELEIFCKTLESKLSVDRDTTMDIWQWTSYAQEIIIPVI